MLSGLPSIPEDADPATATRFAFEAAALASWLTGRCDERLIDAASIAGAGDFERAREIALEALLETFGRSDVSTMTVVCALRATEAASQGKRAGGHAGIAWGSARMASAAMGDGRGHSWTALAHRVVALFPQQPD